MNRILLLCGMLIACPPATEAQEALPRAEEEYATATVLSVEDSDATEIDGLPYRSQHVTLEIESGQDAGTVIGIDNGILNDREDMRLAEGERVVVQRLERADGTVLHLIREKYRLPSLLLLLFLFLLLAVGVGGWTSLRSVAGLGVSILILTFLVVPRIMAGGNPLLASFVGSVLIACTSLYLAHGFHRRTTVALLSTLLTLALSTALAVFAVRMARLFGMGSEESVFLQLGPLQQLNLRGLLLGGIVIGALGVLDDITTAQTAAVDELRRANPLMPLRELLRAGSSIGREHIASLINTLALAYVGASLPLLLLFSVDATTPLWMILNSEYLAEEVVRTLVGSATLLLAVPVSTWLAAVLLHGSGGAAHVHRH